MGIRMVRQPSETPNVTNIDDIVPFRYAYGDQNGYVINKGSQISYTIDGNIFKVNSGRVVLQGVETDIDANGISFTIDNVAETRYYCIYYEVNLATQKTAIKLSAYSTNDYPVIDIGDDLTANPSGIGRLELYRFTATSGVISDIQKTAKPIEYSGTALVGYDISKGTVEERLTSLGFKEANVDFSDSEIIGISISNSYVKLTKIGNYVMVNGVFGGFNPGGYTSGFNRSSNQDTIVPASSSTKLGTLNIFTYGEKRIKLGKILDSSLFPKNTISSFGGIFPAQIIVEIEYLANMGDQVFANVEVLTSGDIYIVLNSEKDFERTVRWSIRSISGFYKLD